MAGLVVHGEKKNQWRTTFQKKFKPNGLQDFAWNARGRARPRFKKNFKQHVKDHNPEVVCSHHNESRVPEEGTKEICEANNGQIGNIYFSREATPSSIQVIIRLYSNNMPHSIVYNLYIGKQNSIITILGASLWEYDDLCTRHFPIPHHLGLRIWYLIDFENTMHGV